MASNQHRQSARRRPAMISELAARAQQTSWNENGDFKYFLRLAERYRKDAKESVTKGDLEDAFIAFARSASIVLERLPNHRDYNSTLNLSQRNNLSLNGQEILDNLGHLKPILLERFEKWSAQHPDNEDSPPPTAAELQQQIQHERVIAEEARRAQEEADMARRRQQQQQPPPSFAAASAVLSAKAAAGISSSRESGLNNQRQQQEEMHARSQEMLKRKQDERLRTTHSPSPSVTSYPTTPGSVYSMPTPSSATSATSMSTSATLYHAGSRAPPAFQPAPVSQPNMYRSISQTPHILPLEHPTKFEDDSTDSERETWSRPQRFDSPLKPARSPHPPPLTTMSPPPPERIEYPKLMNLHQKTQGYQPSRDSMFRYDSQNPSSYQDQYDQYTHRENYHPLPQPPSQPPYSAPAPPLPPPPESSKPELLNGLKIVHLPRDCLNRFLTIAKVNTARDRETCGLLLGKDKGSKYLVTTLLIPKQHATSDTCTMDEEELILQVTEERGLITLGWIHTHPSQSCFMSSVDLHTHSAFQRMLPESFAVVCAPTSVPNFGIFRLTDPPGLGLILSCNAKEAFHPHPDAPIYTDAERGHVQMRDLDLEIVDLR